jgi:hypothetical protein
VREGGREGGREREREREKGQRGGGREEGRERERERGRGGGGEGERVRETENLGRRTHSLPTIVDAPRTLVIEVAVRGVGSNHGDAPRPNHQRAISMRLFRI